MEAYKIEHINICEKDEEGFINDYATLILNKNGKIIEIDINETFLLDKKDFHNLKRAMDFIREHFEFTYEKRGIIDWPTPLEDRYEKVK